MINQRAKDPVFGNTPIAQARDLSLEAPPAVAKRIRRAAIHHALLSYLFGAVILAVAINAVAGLLGG